MNLTKNPSNFTYKFALAAAHSIQLLCSFLYMFFSLFTSAMCMYVDLVIAMRNVCMMSSEKKNP